MFQERKSKTRVFMNFAIALIALLWFYAAISKWLNFGHFREAMYKQPFTPLLQSVLSYGLPPLEILTGSLLIFKRSVFTGLGISGLLFLAFTAYTALILARQFGHIPCSCGGLIEHMGWTFHLYFNLAFLILTITAIIIFKRKEYSDI
jgi:putative oxidoreductase